MGSGGERVRERGAFYRIPFGVTSCDALRARGAKNVVFACSAARLTAVLAFNCHYSFSPNMGSGGEEVPLLRNIHTIHPCGSHYL